MVKTGGKGGHAIRMASLKRGLKKMNEIKAGAEKTIKSAIKDKVEVGKLMTELKKDKAQKVCPKMKSLMKDVIKLESEAGELIAEAQKGIAKLEKEIAKMQE